MEIIINQAVLMQPKEVNSGVNIQSIKDPLRSWWMLKGSCDLMGKLSWSRLLAGSVAPWGEELTLEQIC